MTTTEEAVVVHTTELVDPMCVRNRRAPVARSGPYVSTGPSVTTETTTRSWSIAPAASCPSTVNDHFSAPLAGSRARTTEPDPTNIRPSSTPGVAPGVPAD